MCLLALVIVNDIGINFFLVIISHLWSQVLNEAGMKLWGKNLSS